MTKFKVIGGEIVTYEDRPSWLEGRRKSVGASDAPVLFGEGYKGDSVWSLFQSKRGNDPERTERELEFLEVGLYMQPAIVNLARDRLGLDIVEEPEFQIRRHPDFDWITSSLDAYIPDAARMVIRARSKVNIPDFVQGFGTVEVKYPGTYQAPHWKEGAPLKHQIQSQQQMACTGAAWGLVLGLIGHSLRYHFVRRHEEFIQELIEVDSEFWGRVVDNDPPPVDDSEATKRAILALYPHDLGHAVYLPDEFAPLHDRLEEIKRTQSDLESERDHIENQLREAIGEATYGILPNGSYYSHKHQKRAGHWVNGSEYRVLRHSTTKRVFKFKEAS